MLSNVSRISIQMVGSHRIKLFINACALTSAYRKHAVSTDDSARCGSPLVRLLASFDSVYRFVSKSFTLFSTHISQFESFQKHNISKLLLIISGFQSVFCQHIDVIFLSISISLSLCVFGVRSLLIPLHRIAVFS